MNHIMNILAEIEGENNMKEKDIIRSKLTSNNYEIPNINNFSSEIQQSIIDYIEQI